MFIFGAITSDPNYIIYKPQDSPEFIELDNFIQKVEVDDLQEMKDQLRKSFKSMMKAGAAKTADIMIP